MPCLVSFCHDTCPAMLKGLYSTSNHKAVVLALPIVSNMYLLRALEQDTMHA